LVKDTKVGFLGEAGLIQFRAEFFDVLNHPNFALPNGVALSGSTKDLTPFSETPRGTAGESKRHENLRCFGVQNSIGASAWRGCDRPKNTTVPTRTDRKAAHLGFGRV
jgi:hypothetical protein